MATYEISTIQEFINFWGTVVKGNTSENSEAITGKLMNNIDFIGSEYALNFPSFGGGGTPSSTGTKIYNITFDGNNKRICNFSKVYSSGYYALFGEITLYNSTIKDLYIDNAIISVGNYIGLTRGSVKTTYQNVCLRNFNVTANSSVYLWGYLLVEDLFYKCAVINSDIKGYSITGFGDGYSRENYTKYQYCVSNGYFKAIENNNYTEVRNFWIGSYSGDSSSIEGSILCCISKDVYEGFGIIDLFRSQDRGNSTCYANYCYIASRFIDISRSISAYTGSATLSYIDTDVAGKDGCISLLNVSDNFKATTEQLKSKEWLKKRGWIFA